MSASNLHKCVKVKGELDVYFSIEEEKKTKTVQREISFLSLSRIQSEDFNLINLSKKVCLRAYLSVDKTDE